MTGIGRPQAAKAKSAARTGRPARACAWVAATLAALATAANAAERAIDKEVVVAAPIEAVWQAWTTRAGIRTFFAPDAEIDARVGGAFHIYINPLAEPGMKGADDMRFMALQPPTMLSFDWNAPPSLPEVRAQRTFVVVRLAPIDAQVDARDAAPHGLGPRRPVGPDVCLFRPRLGQRPRQPEEELRERADRLDRLDGADEGGCGIAVWRAALR